MSAFLPRVPLLTAVEPSSAVSGLRDPWLGNLDCSSMVALSNHPLLLRNKSTQLE